MQKEAIYFNGAMALKQDKVLIVCDRGILDNKAYMSNNEFKNLLKKLNKKEIELREQYDAVFHLVTAAKGAAEFYNLDNAARTEGIKEASILDDKLINAWTGHSHFRIIDNSTDFENKMKRLLSEISHFLGEPEPYEIERKFLIKMPDIKMLDNLPNCEKVNIVQTYLKSDDNKEIRIRQRGINGEYTYSKTEKITISGIKRIEREARLSQDEYLELLTNADNNRNPIIKTRYCLSINNQYFEIDIYPFWQDQAIVEIELLNENDPIYFPDFIQVIEEVTESAEYKNAALAKKKIS